MSYFLEILEELYYALKHVLCFPVFLFFLGVLEFDTPFHVVDFHRVGVWGR